MQFSMNHPQLWIIFICVIELKHCKPPRSSLKLSRKSFVHLNRISSEASFSLWRGIYGISIFPFPFGLSCGVLRSFQRWRLVTRSNNKCGLSITSVNIWILGTSTFIKGDISLTHLVQFVLERVGGSFCLCPRKPAPVCEYSHVYAV